MGLFDTLSKVGKRITRGISKIFETSKDIGGRVTGSDWGRTLMAGAAVFVGGMAVTGGYQGWQEAAARGEGYMGRFVAGGSGFLKALGSPVEQARKLRGADTMDDATAKRGSLENAAAVDQANPSPIQQPQQQQQRGMPQGPPSQLPTQPTTPAATDTRTAAQMPKEPESWLSKAAGFAKEFVMSPGGQEIIGNVLSGYAGGKAREEEMKFEDRVRRSWMDPNNALARMNKAGGPSFSVQQTPSPMFYPQFAPQRAAAQPVQTSGMMPGEPAPVGG